MGLQSRRVLAIEDDPTARRVLVKTLEQLGHAVTVAEDGASGLALLDLVRPEIVITDWEMTDIDGLAVCRAIRQRAGEAYVYVIVLTGRKEKSDVVVALEAGADEFLTKPFQSAELSARLATAHRVLTLEATLAGQVRSLADANAALRDREAALLEAERMATVGRVGVTVKHEVNNPLQAIFSHVDLCLAERGGTPNDVVRSLEAIGKLARRISEVVASLEAPKSVKTTEYIRGSEMIDLRAADGGDK